ncbi:MAG: N-acetylmuramoyl-L-alanine amidase [Porphyromonadaceae bacterium]|nr:N-acetylmuramoyl-L-alanine amidase [Porphyromonadaceae bacterium]
MDKKAIRYIVIHCSATRSTQAYSATQLDRDHRSRGFDGAGYHFYIRRDGSTKAMRPLSRSGAHALGYNRCSIGVCYEGGLDAFGRPADTRTPEQRACLVELLGRLRQSYPRAEIVGHRDLSPDRNADGVIEPNEWIKVCPCFDARGEYANL